MLKIFIILLLDNNWEHKKFPDLTYTKFLPTYFIEMSNETRKYVK